jgi:hypothetical protein
MQLDGMTLRHETCIARNRRRFLHRYPSNFQFRHYVQWFLALTNRARYSGAQVPPTDHDRSTSSFHLACTFQSQFRIPVAMKTRK